MILAWASPFNNSGNSIDDILRPTLRLHGFLPNKHDALTRCWFYVRPPSATLAQRKTSIGSRRGVCWVVICLV